MNEVKMGNLRIDDKCVAIVRFGPETSTGGFRPGEYYQVTIDPKFSKGDFIRFGQYEGDQINGWQRISALTVVDVLGFYAEDKAPLGAMNDEGITMRRTL